MTVNILANDTSIDINAPQYPYTVIVNMCMKKTQAVYGRIYWADNGITYDSRSVELNWLLNDGQSLLLQNIMTDEARENEVRITLPAASGLFLFGPDLGDAGIYWSKLSSIEPSGMKYKPYRWFEAKTVFNIISSPEYEIPAADGEGKFSLGTVTGIRQMQGEIENSFESGVNINESLSGKITSIDLASEADIYDANIQILASNNKMAKIVYYLQHEIRGNVFTVKNQCNNYLFGAQKEASDEYTVLLRENNFKCTCNKHNQWIMDLKVRLIS